jgi:hypothetical protein
MCRGTGRNHHSGFACDACGGTGEHSWVSGLMPVGIILASVGGFLWLVHHLYVWIHG